MARVIEVIVTPQGQASIQTKGYAGGECMQASQFLEHALGVRLSDRRTAEFYQSTTAEQQVQQ
jgi:hypothetical protein